MLQAHAIYIISSIMPPAPKTKTVTIEKIKKWTIDTLGSDDVDGVRTCHVIDYFKEKFPNDDEFGGVFEA